MPRATLYRWERQPEPKSRRPHRLRTPRWSPDLVEAVEQLRLDNPMWGKRKLAVLLRREGFAVSASTVGRILAKLVARGIVTPVPVLRRKPGGRRLRFMNKQPHARRPPKGMKPTRPGELVQIDTLFINIQPDKPVKHFTAYDPVARRTTGDVGSRATASRARTLLDKLIAEAPFPIAGVQSLPPRRRGSMAEASSRPSSKPHARHGTCRSSSSRPNAPSSTAPANATRALGRYAFHESYDLPHRFDHVRPHDALDGPTPAEYLETISNGRTMPSHRC